MNALKRTSMTMLLMIWGVLKFSILAIAVFAFLVDVLIPALACDMNPDACQAAAETVRQSSVLLRILGVAQ